MDEQIDEVIKNPRFDLGIVGVVAFGAGLGLGYILWRKPKPYVLHAVPDPVDLDISTEELTEIRDRRLDELKETHPAETIIVEGEGDSAKVAYDKPKEQVLEVIVEETDELVVTHNVFAESNDDWDYEKEVESRTEHQPYILHKDEFYEDEKNYTQTTYTYYELDNIMVDEDDTPVYNHGHVVGQLQFGHGSGDANVFYVRNDKNRAEYEIVKHTGAYSVEVLGLEIEDNARAQDIKHSSHRRFRADD